MGVFAAYVDAGGTTDPAPVYSLGCAVSTPERWIDFDARWQGAKIEFGLTKPFHMTDYNALTDQFAPWSGLPDRRQRFGKLLSIAASSVVLTAAYAVERALYEANVPDDVNEYMGGSPYGFLFMQLTIEVDETLRKMAQFGAIDYDYQVAYIVESGDVGSAAIINAYNKGSRDSDFFQRIPSVSTAKKGSFSPLDLADIVAWTAHRNIAGDFGHRNAKGGLIDDKSGVVDGLFSKPNRWAYYKQDGLHLRHDVNTIQQILGQPKEVFLT